MANGLEERRKNIDKVNEQPLIKKRDNSLAGGARKFGRAALRSLALPFGGAVERGAGPAGKQLLAAGKGALAAGTLLPIPKSKKKVTKAVGIGGVKKGVVEGGLEAAKVATGKTGKTGVPFGTSGTRRLPSGTFKTRTGEIQKVHRFIGTAKPTKKQKGGVRKSKDISPRTVQGIGRALDLFGERAQQFLSPEAQKRRGAARGKAAGVKSRRAESELQSKRITAIGKARASLGEFGGERTKALLDAELESLISPTDPQEALDLKSTLRR